MYRSSLSGCWGRLWMYGTVISIGCGTLKKELLTIQWSHLKRRSMKLGWYTEASFATIDYQSSLICSVIFPCESQNLCHILDFAKTMQISGRIYHSWWKYAFIEGYDSLISAIDKLERVRNEYIQTAMVTDSKMLFDVTTEDSVNSEKGLKIEKFDYSGTLEKGNL